MTRTTPSFSRVQTPTKTQAKSAPHRVKRGISLSSVSARLLRAFLLILVGATITAGSATSDAYLHRGASEDSGVVYRQPTGQGLATNVELRDLSANRFNTPRQISTESGMFGFEKTVDQAG